MMLTCTARKKKVAEKKAVLSATAGRKISTLAPQRICILNDFGGETHGANRMSIDLNLEHLPVPPRKKDFRIGAVGAGFIMRDIHLVAYKNAGFNVVAIASKDPSEARATAELRGV
ncbi:MAG TPA: hypothetical protein VEN79_16370, partial [Terriglobia bacterium]|nr:hypothetical protein [Terriglobia bacterium]